MSRKQPKRRAGKAVAFTLVGVFICAVIGGIGLGVASADSADEAARAGAFGFDEATTSATADFRRVSDSGQAMVVYERSVLAAPASRDLAAGFKMIDDMEEAERQRIEAENAAAIARMEAEKAKQGVVSTSDDEDDSAEEVTEYELPAVDWSVGKDAFVKEWTGRIDAYLAGSPLSGYGSVFAEAAWDNGVDPRWSPAISNTESGKGSVCFMPCNAWGWGSASWGDWESAIRSHVAGLASGYGYSITVEAAQVYCPPFYADWYNKTIEQMALI